MNAVSLCINKLDRPFEWMRCFSCFLNRKKQQTSQTFKINSGWPTNKWMSKLSEFPWIQTQIPPRHMISSKTGAGHVGPLSEATIGFTDGPTKDRPNGSGCFLSNSWRNERQSKCCPWWICWSSSKVRTKHSLLCVACPLWCSLQWPSDKCNTATQSWEC